MQVLQDCLPSSLCWTLQCPYADTPLSCCVLRYANADSVNHSQIHHLCDETDPPSAETLSQTAKTYKTVQLSDKRWQPSPKAPRPGWAMLQPAQHRKLKPLEFVSTYASQPEVFTHMVGMHLCAVPDSLFRGLQLAQAPCLYNVNGAPRQPSKYPRKNRVCYPFLAIFHFFSLEYLDFA